MREARVKTHDAVRTRQHTCHLAHLQERRHGATTVGRDALGHGLLRLIAPQQHGGEPSRAHLAPHGHPSRFRPVLFLAAGVRNDHAVLRRCRPLHLRCAQAKVGRALWHGVAQVHRRQLPTALHRMQVAWHAKTAPVQQAGQGFTRTAPVIAHQRPIRLHAPQGAFEQTLQVQHQVVAFGFELLAQR